jgi:hypothetical protein
MLAGTPALRRPGRPGRDGNVIIDISNSFRWCLGRCADRAGERSSSRKR